MNKIRTLLKTSLFKTASIYTGTNVIRKAIPFLLLPILTRYLSAEDYGIVSMFAVVVSILTSLVGVNTHGAIARNYYDKSKDDLKVYISSTMMILLYSLTFISIVFLIVGRFIAELSSLPLIMLWVALAIAVGRYIMRVTLVLWQVQKQAWQYGFFTISNSAVNVLLSLLFVVGLGFAWQGRIYAQLITAGLFLIIGVIFLLKNKWLGLKTNKDDLIDAFKFGLPLIPHIIGAILITMIDRFFITYYVGIAETGIYTVGYQIGTIISVLATSFNQAYVPWLYEKLKLNSPKVKQQIVKFTYAYFVVIILLAIGLTVTSNLFLQYFVGEQFSNSSIYVGWIALGYAFQGMYFMVVNYLFYIKRTNFIGLITIVLAISNIILNIIFVPIYGALGAAYATTIAYFLQFIAVWILSSKLYPMPWNPIKLFKNKI